MNQMIFKAFILVVLLFVSFSKAMAQSKHAYFDWLVSLPEHYSSSDLRSPEEVLDQVHYSRKEKATTVYDPVMDAAKFTIDSGKPSVAVGDQVRHRFPYVDSGNLLFYWECYVPS